ncbi:MAG: hypothetical protein F9K32_09280 [Desulfobulbaceae bacterium]|nr:MAG: hypothetical protein F9K32_09280 [Desulfobulbaceae bacterium]
MKIAQPKLSIATSIPGIMTIMAWQLRLVPCNAAAILKSLLREIDVASRGTVKTATLKVLSDKILDIYDACCCSKRVRMRPHPFHHDYP